MSLQNIQGQLHKTALVAAAKSQEDNTAIAECVESIEKTNYMAGEDTLNESADWVQLKGLILPAGTPPPEPAPEGTEGEEEEEEEEEETVEGLCETNTKDELLGLADEREIEGVNDGMTKAEIAAKILGK